MNAQSLVNKIALLKDICLRKKPAILIAAETHLTDEFDAEIQIPGFNVNRCNSHSRHTGGVAIYTNDKLKINNVNLTPFSLTCRTWILSMDVMMNKKFTVIGIYKSPVEKNVDFIKILDNYIEKYVKSDSNVIAVGDININLARKSKTGDEYLNAIREFGLKQIVKDFTRVDVKKKTATLIDHILTNVNGLKYLINKEEKISDHFMIEIFPDKVSMITSNSMKKFKMLKNYDEKIFLNRLNNCGLSLNSSFDEVIEKIDIVNQSFIVEKSQFIKKKMHFNEKLFMLKKKKNELYKKYCYSNDDQDYLIFEKAYKEYRINLKNAEASAIHDEIEKNKNDPKRLWRVLKSLYKEEINEIDVVQLDDGSSVDDDVEIANAMNEFFITSVDTIVNNIPNADNDNYLENISSPSNKFSLSEIDIGKLRLTTNLLKKKNFVDLVSGRTLNDLVKSENGGKIILNCINTSLNEGKIPLSLKCSVVSPLPKIKNPKQIVDYRPVNNLPVFDKIIETIVLDQVQSFLIDEQILCNEQHGFRPKHNCETAVLSLLSTWIDNIEKKKAIVTIFLDFKRAFETINRRILIEKLKKYGFDDRSVRWFEDYLSCRTQKTVISGKFSRKIDVNVGVPQGSKLSNILFSLYINDIVKLALKEEAEFVLYADDTSITVVGDNLEEAIRKANGILKRIDDWLKFNKIAINVSKCKYMTINSKDETNDEIILCNIPLDKVESMKYLGVILDCKLKMLEHCEYIKKIIVKKLGFFYRNHVKMNRSAKITYLKSLVIPHFDMCSSVLLLVDKGKIDELERIQKKFVRIILNDKNTPINELYDKIKVVTVKNRLRVNSIKLIEKIMSKGIPNLKDKFILYSDWRSRLLRSAPKISVPKFNCGAARRSIFMEGIIDYNDFTDYRKKYPLNNFIVNCIKFVKEFEK